MFYLLLKAMAIIEAYLYLTKATQINIYILFVIYNLSGIFMHVPVFEFYDNFEN